jgi:zinc finger RNA-binding protein
MVPTKTIPAGLGTNGQQVPIVAQPAIITAPPQINLARSSQSNSQNSSLIGPMEPQQDQQTSTGSAITVNANLTLPGIVDESGQAIACEINEDELVNIEPVGKEYIETKLEGKILSFYCKLCECQFNDPNAKDMHTKGRRHRLAYKKKVDPSLRVDMKGSSSVDKKQQRNGREQRADRSLDNRGQQNQTQQQRQQQLGNGGGAMIKPLMGSNSTGGSGGLENASATIGAGGLAQGLQQLMATQYNQYQGGGHQFQNRYESFDDKHIISKHNSIYPTQDEVSSK